jgi:hypothetical protein
MTNFISDEAFVRIRTIRALRKVLSTEKQGYQNALYRRCASGLTLEQFDEVVRGLVNSQWCSLKEGDRGGVLIVFNEACASVAVPEGE